MADSYRVWLVDYQGPTPASWHDNPDEAFIRGLFNHPFNFNEANEFAYGYNEAEIRNPKNVWAIILKDDAQVEIGQSINISNFANSN